MHHEKGFVRVGLIFDKDRFKEGRSNIYSTLAFEADDEKHLLTKMTKEGSLKGKCNISYPALMDRIYSRGQL